MNTNKKTRLGGRDEIGLVSAWKMIIGVATIGVGTRGSYLLEQAQECSKTEIRVICDLYDSNLKRAA
jgi:hypothetical protein